MVGGRCAGASTARLMSGAGLKVLLVDQASFPSDPISTHCITLPGLQQLARWGLLDRVVSTSAPVIRRLDFEVANRLEPFVFGEGKGAWNIAPRRYALDSVLLEAARDAGVTVWDRIRIQTIKRHPRQGISVAGQTKAGERFDISAGAIIGADGRHSIVARHMGAQIKHSATSNLTGWYTYFSNLPRDTAHWSFGDATAAGSFPTNSGMTCVWAMRDSRILSRGRRDRLSLFYSTLKEASTCLYEQVVAAPMEARLTSINPDDGYIGEAFGDGWALVGDACMFAHPITAHGISDAFRDAQLLAETTYSYLDGQLSWHDAEDRYQQNQQAAGRRIFDATQQIASADWDTAELMKKINEYKRGVQTQCHLA
jgi:2-polyprenyl-6-methoxyphenol hydroxylase-like FAD-dependent oxidoreductase